MSVTCRQSALPRVVEISGARSTRFEVEYIPRLELVELDGRAPKELWFATAAGAHGNRQDRFFALVDGQPVEFLSVGTDEGELEVKDLNGDAQPEIAGTASIWFDGQANDFTRPLVLGRRAGRWQDITTEFPQRIQRHIRDWQHAEAQSSYCAPAHALNIYGLSVLVKDARAGERYVKEHCDSTYETWFRRNHGRIRTVALHPPFDTKLRTR